jgi:hypothetical protein
MDQLRERVLVERDLGAGRVFGRKAFERARECVGDERRGRHGMATFRHQLTEYAKNADQWSARIGP